MNGSLPLIFPIFVGVYLFALIAVGAIKARKIRSQADFSLAGRGLGTFVLIGTLLATWIGTGSIFGNAEETVRVGMPAFLIPIAGGLGILVLYMLAPMIRRRGQFTIQDILQDRFGAGARIIGTLTLVLAYVIIVSYQYRAGSEVLVRIFPGLEPNFAVVIVALFVMAYTALAGMYSVAYTDVANGLLMTAGLLLALPYLWVEVGGGAGLLEALPEAKRNVFGTYRATELLSILLPAFLLIIGDANMYQRFFSAKDPATARKSALGMFFGVILLEWVIIGVAICGAALMATGKLSPVGGSRNVVVGLAFETLPPWLGAALAATIVAIVVSTADSFLLSPATAIVRDVYQRGAGRRASDRKLVFMSRVVVLLLGLVALGLAFLSDKYFGIALFAYTIYGAGITPALLAALFWRGATRAGAVAGMLTGVSLAILWKLDGSAYGPGVVARICTRLTDSGHETWAKDLAGLDAVLPAVLGSILVLWIVSLLTKKS